MENQKKGKGKTIIIIILLLLVLGLSGFIAYDKFYSKSSSETSKNEQTDLKDAKIKELNDKIKTLENTKNDATINPTEKLIGNWSYEETFKLDDKYDCTAKINLTLNYDGTYNYENSSTCGGGTLASGTWALNNNTIYLHNEKCQPVIDVPNNDKCVYPNCKAIIELNYSGEQIFDKRIGGILVNLVKK